MRKCIAYNFNHQVLVVLFSLVIVISAFYLNYGSNAPTIHADEGSYLANAAAIAGFSNDMVNSYHAGYSILISPAFMLASSPEQVWALVKIINAILLGSSFLALNLMAKILTPQVGFLQRVVLSFLVTLYPMWTTLSSYAMSENAYVPIFLFTTVAFLNAIKKGEYYWVILGVLAGFLYWVHPKGAVVLLAIFLSLAYWSYTRRKLVGPIAALFTIFMMVLVYRLGFVPWLEHKMMISGLPFSGYKPSVAKVMAPLASIDGIKNTFIMLAGQLFYLSLGTLGILWAGVASLYRNSVVKRELLVDFSSDDTVTFSLFIMLSFVGTLALSSLFMGGLSGNVIGMLRLDHFMYGRYIESVIAPLVLIGLMLANYRSAVLGVGIALISAIILYLGMGQFTNTAPLNVSAFWQEFYLRDGGVAVWFMTGTLLIIIVISLPRKFVLPLIGLFFIFCSYAQMKHFHKNYSNLATHKVKVADYVRKNYKKGTCVGFDYSGATKYSTVVFWYDLSFVLYDYRFQKLSFNEWLKSCDGPLFSYAKDLSSKANVYSPVSSLFGGPLLWVKK